MLNFIGHLTRKHFLEKVKVKKSNFNLSKSIPSFFRGFTFDHLWTEIKATLSIILRIDLRIVPGDNHNLNLNTWTNTRGGRGDTRVEDPLNHILSNQIKIKSNLNDKYCDDKHHDSPHLPPCCCGGRETGAGPRLRGGRGGRRGSRRCSRRPALRNKLSTASSRTNRQAMSDFSFF